MKIKNNKIFILCNYVFSFIKKYPEEKIGKNFIFLYTVIIVTSAITALSPVALKYVIDSFNLNKYSIFNVTSLLLILYVISQSLTRVFADFQWSIYGRIEQKIHKLIRINSIKHISKLQINVLHEYSSGQLIQSINNGLRSVTMFMQSFLQVGLSIFFQILGISIIVLTFYDLTFLLVIVTGISFYIFFFLKGNNNIANKNKEVIDSQNELGASMQSSIQYPDSNKYLNSHKDYVDIINELSIKTQKSWIKYYDTSIKSSLITSLIFLATLGSITFLAYKNLLSGKMTLGDFVLMITYVLQLVKPIEAIGQIFRQIDQSKALLDNFNKINDLKTEDELWPGKINLEADIVSIDFNKVSFSYPKKNNVILNEISFRIDNNKKIIVIGETGSGKSTLIKLLSGFYTSYSGLITINGIDIKELNLENLRNNISVISQECNIYNLPIWQNITIGTNFSKKNAMNISEKLGIDKFIKLLPNGYETLASEHGVKLSGGERQRIALARALLKNSSIILLDEPTSSLDINTEREIIKLIFDVFKDKTLLIISHRLSIIDDDCKILLIKDSKLIEVDKKILI